MTTFMACSDILRTQRIWVVTCCKFVDDVDDIFHRRGFEYCLQAVSLRLDGDTQKQSVALVVVT